MKRLPNLPDNGCVPLAERELHIPSQRKAWQAGGIMLLSAGAAALAGFSGWPLPSHWACWHQWFYARYRHAVYEAVDRPAVVLAALMPVAGATETTGTADPTARSVLDHLAQGNAIVGLGLILVVTMRSCRT